MLEYNRFEETYSDVWWYKLKNGTACYAVLWNSLAGEGLGDIEIAQIDMLNLFWEPGVRDIQDSRSVFLVTYADNELLDAAYPALKGRLRSAVHTNDRLRPERCADNNGLSALLYGIAEKFSNCYVIDLYKYGPVIDESFEEKFYLYGHLNPSGYILFARIIDSYIDYIIRSNFKDFKQVGFIGKGVHNELVKW